MTDQVLEIVEKWARHRYAANEVGTAQTAVYMAVREALKLEQARAVDLLLRYYTDLPLTQVEAISLDRDTRDFLRDSK